jgi:hypothetical protein
MHFGFEVPTVTKFTQHCSNYKTIRDNFNAIELRSILRRHPEKPDDDVNLRRAILDIVKSA